VSALPSCNSCELWKVLSMAMHTGRSQLEESKVPNGTGRKWPIILCFIPLPIRPA